jgi:chromosome partitioning protein
MKTVSFVCQKGGTGKTTLALNIAVEALQGGLAVALADLDPQTSACAWGDLRKNKDDPAIVDVQPGRLAAVVEKARETGLDLLLVDTAGRTEQAALAAARTADLVVIPLQPSVIDLKTVKATTELIRLAGDRATLAVLVRVKPFGSRHDETRAWLEGEGLSVCPFTIGDRVTFQDAYAAGLGVAEFEPFGKAGQEIRDVYMYISQLVGLPNIRSVNNDQETELRGQLA